MTQSPAEQREPGPVWGGWWLWEPPHGVTKESDRAPPPIVMAPPKPMHRPSITITGHAIHRWQQRIEPVSAEDAMVAIIAALASAKPKHLAKGRIRKETFYVPTERAMLVGSKGKIVTVLERGQSLYDRATADEQSLDTETK